jgi:hypothetical protein
MRARTSFVAVIAAFASVTAVAYAGGPGDVYNDYAQDGRLSCNHSRADLEAVLRSGSLNQYGDPYTLARLKLAVRRQLGGGCRGASRSSGAGTGSKGGRGAAGEGSATGQPGATGGHGKRGGTGSVAGKTNKRTNGDGGGTQAGAEGGGTGNRSSASSPASSGNGSFVSERALIAGLLVAGLAIGGWLTRRGLAARH